jgi:YD repeat-containing protein
MRWLALLVLLACSPAPMQSRAPVVHAKADAPHPGPCATEELGSHGRVIVTYEYGPQARLVREVGRGDARRIQRLWIYDDEGRRARELVIEGDRLHAIWYVYDDRGSLVAIEEDATGKRDVVLRRERDYDAQGRLVRLATLRPDGDTIEEHAFHYDPRGRLVLEIVARGQETDRIEIDLDPGGRIVARRGRREAQRFDYSMTGRLEAMTIERDGRPHRSRRYGYDSAGNLLTTQTLDGDGHVLQSTRHSYACW